MGKGYKYVYIYRSILKHTQDIFQGELGYLHGLWCKIRPDSALALQ